MSRALMDLFVESVQEIVTLFEESLYHNLRNQPAPYGHRSTFSTFQNFHNTLFNEYFTYHQFVAHLVFWIYKDFYIDNLPRKSFSALNQTKDIVDNSTMDKETYRRYIDRGIEKVYKQKQQDAERLGTSTEYIDLVAKKEKQDGEKSEVYHLTEVDIPAIESYQADGLEIIHLLTRGTIVHSKGGVSGKKIASAYKEYLAYIEKGKQQTDSDAWINALIDLSSLESQCCPSFLYAVAKYMSANDIRGIPASLPLLCGLMKTDKGYIESRFLCNRIENIPRFFQSTLDSFKPCLQFQSLLHLQAQVLSFAKVERNAEKLLPHIDSDVAKEYFSAHYNLFSVCASHAGMSSTWNPKLVKAYRKVISVMTHTGYEKSAAVAVQDKS